MSDLNPPRHAAPEPLTVQVDMELSDMLRANFWFWLNSGTTRFVAVALLLLLIFTLFNVIGGEVQGREFFFVVLPAILLVSFLPLFILFNTWRNFVALKEFQKHVTYHFRADGYDVADGKSSSQMAWESVVKAVESGDAFYLFLNKFVFHVLPKRFFADPAAIQRLRELLKVGLGAQAKVRG